ncbi:MAG: methyl-accepting chemotaxis protein [Anaerocolumna aminovalerica]|jgi:methyl-accepting chemotaxis protein|uniref:methyl-accepting chemotaxis protein n=1 Tax=Anaerocolumna aminovalerica TaxID=1527 RepID=UPI0029088615|nr:methyl-accepting chemotaxis protein [Anaerocolumna aminovalerica]MDU6266335.1 methyl-accepting chemotaxis protein [Anaerocolumna aminovalerica]
MKNLSVSKKLVVGFGSVLILMLLSIVVSLLNINRVGEQIESYGQYTLPNNTSVWIIRRDIVSAQRYLVRAFIEKDKISIEKLLTQAEADGKSALAELDKYAVNQEDTDIDEKIKNVRVLMEQAGSVRVQIAELLKNPTDTSLQIVYDMFLNQYVPPFDQATEILNELTETANTRSEQRRIDSQNTVKLAWFLLISCAVVSLLMTVAVIIAIRKSILNPIMEIVEVFEEISKGNMKTEIQYESRDEMGQMARLIQSTNMLQGTILMDVIEKFSKISKGDLQIRVDLDYPGDFAILKETIENTVSTLNHTMQTINIAAEQVSVGAEQVAGGAQELAAGSTEQASSVEELSVSITKIAEQAEKNMINVKIATQHVEEAGTVVNAGDEHMQQLTKTMEDINSASNQIANITKVIEDIAFQTNILSLNAAIEAARAGDSGKGFAVVADEVRNLAAKSAEAAKEAAELIQYSTVTVAEGSQITAQTAQILHDVREKAEIVNENIIKIEKASSEQTFAIEQIKQGLIQVTAVVQTNAATAEENSATSEEMSAQAATLREEVEKFKLYDETERGSNSGVSSSKSSSKQKESMHGIISGLKKY